MGNCVITRAVDNLNDMKGEGTLILVCCDVTSTLVVI